MREDGVATERRSLFGRLAGVVALGAAGLARAPAAAAEDEPNWPGTLKGRYQQVFDGVESRNGKVLGYAANFLMTNPADAAVSVIVLRDSAVVIALASEMWTKYRIGEALKFVDP